MRCRLISLFILLLLLPSFQTSAEEGYSDDFRHAVETEDSLLSEQTDLNDPSSIQKDLSFKHIFSYIGRQVSSSFHNALSTFVKGVAMVLLSVLVNRCSGNIQNQNLQLLFSFIVTLSIALMCESALRLSAEALQKAIQDMSIFTTACIPHFAVVMISAGEGGGSTVFSGAMVLLGEFGTLLSQKLLLPFADVYLAIGICSAVSDEYDFMTIGQNIRRFLIWSIGILVVLFRLVMRLQNTAASAGDQLIKRYIRAAIGTMLPVAGGTLSQGVDGLFAVATGVKTSFAIAGVLIVLSIMLPSLISIGIYGLSWSFCRWVASFMNDATMRSVADVLSNGFYVMLAMGGAVALMGLFSFFGIILQVG